MPTTIVALNILVLVLPGFVALKVRDALAIVPKSSDLSRVIDALVYTMFANVIYFPLSKCLGLRQTLPFEESSSGKVTGLIIHKPAEVLVLIGVGFFLGLIVGVATDKDWVYNIKCGLRLSSKLKIDVWTDVFRTMSGKWCLVCRPMWGVACGICRTVRWACCC
jgi:hypothetical protein